MPDLIFEHLRSISGIECIPDGWDYGRVGDKCDLGRGRVISQIEIREKPGPFPVYSSQTTDEGCMGYLATNDFEGEYATWTTDGANAGTVFYRSGKFNCTNVCGTIKPKLANSIDLNFLVYHLNRVSKRYVSYHGNPKLMNDVMANIVLTFPPYEEQRAIAAILSTLDDAIRQTEALIEKLKRMKAGMLHDLLKLGINENGELRDPSHHPEQFKDSQLGRVPKGWQIKRLLEIVSIVEGQVDPKAPQFADFILVAPDHIESATGRLLDLKTARQQGAISGKYHFLEGDVVYSKIRPYLRKVWLATFEGICSADMYPLRPGMQVDSQFLLMTLLDERFSSFAISVSERSGFPKINRTELSSFWLALPHKSEQERIAFAAKSLDERLLEEQLGMRKLVSLKQGIMQDLLTGRVRVCKDLTKKLQTLFEGTAK